MLKRAKNRRLALESLEHRYAFSGLTPAGPDFPFREATVDYLGTVVSRPSVYDLQPSVMYDATDVQRPYKMWWLGQQSGEEPGDRIFFSHAKSPDGPWSEPIPVLAPQLGLAGRDQADDHLLGSPAVLRVEGTYYMYYEAYGMYATAIQRYFSFAKGDTWTYNGTPQSESDPTYAHERALGIAPRYQKTGTHPIYAGEVTYFKGMAGKEKISRFLRKSPIAPIDPNGNPQRALNGNMPIFYLYDSPAAGRKLLSNYFDLQSSNNFVTDDISREIPKATSVPDTDFELGYAAIDLNSPDMAYALQNRIMLATSKDGVNWSRFDGAGSGDSVIEPRNARKSVFDIGLGHAGSKRPSDPNHVEYWDIVRFYGSGFPGALVRESSLELFFTDDSSLEIPGGLPQSRVRIPVAGINDASAYRDADSPTSGNRDDAFYGTDIAWSPLAGRYYFVGFAPNSTPDRISPNLHWSSYTTNPNDLHYSVAAGNLGSRTFQETLPTRFDGTLRRRGVSGAILTNELGQTFDFPTGQSAHTSFHVFYEASNVSGNSEAELKSDDDNVFARDLDHLLILGYHKSPRIETQDVRVTEGNSETTTAQVEITLSESTGLPVSVDISTTPDSANSDDYVPITTTLVFAPFETRKVIDISIRGDKVDEDTELFSVKLSSPKNANLAIERIVVTIVDDDPPLPASFGDFDGDGSVTFQDFLILSSNFERDVPRYTLGDADGNSRVDFADFLIVAENFNRPVPNA